MEDYVCVENAWIEQIMKGPNKVQSNMGGGVVSICYGTYNIHRTEASVSCFRGRLARESQVYLACLAYIRNRKVSGVNEEDLKLMEMQTFRRRHGNMGEDGMNIFSTPLKYIDVATYLSDQPKFSDKY